MLGKNYLWYESEKIKIMFIFIGKNVCFHPLKMKNSKHEITNYIQWKSSHQKIKNNFFFIKFNDLILCDLPIKKFIQMR